MDLFKNLDLSVLNNLDLDIIKNLDRKSALYGLGLLYGASTTWKILKTVYNVFRTFLPFQPDFHKFGKWVVVTGATDGIGKGFAEEFASKGLPIVLISRTQTKLDNVAAEISGKYGVETKTLALDFGEATEESYEKVKSFLQELDVGVLVNNVGVSAPGVNFLDTPALSYKIRSVLEVNINSVCKMTETVLPGMVNRQRGLLLNMSAMAVVRPTPNMTLYGASKAFIDYFSQSLQAEYQKDNITVVSMKPAHVVTNMVGNEHGGILSVTPRQYAKSLLGLVGRKKSAPGCWQHDVTEFLFLLFPDPIYFFLMKTITAKLMEHPALRNAALNYVPKKTA